MDPPEEEKKKEGELQKVAARTINALPLTTTTDFSPYLGLEFDLAVQEYCRQTNNHIIHKQDLNQKTGKQKIYNAINTPFNKIVRSCKLVVSGDVAVGKTCLVNRFGHDLYTSPYQTTIGIDFDIQRFNILGQPYVVQIWDTAGLEKFRCITNSYYRGCQVALLVFDVTNMSTLANVLRWKDEVLEASKTFDQLSNEHSLMHNTNNNNGLPHKGHHHHHNHHQSQWADSSQPLLFLVGTKCDLPMNEVSRSFIREQANKIASILKAELWFVSARTGENVSELFHRVAALSFNRRILNEIQQTKYEKSTLGANLKEKLLQHQKELWHQSSKLIKITKKREGDEKRSKCINVQCVIK